jgi:hypothetical protein
MKTINYILQGFGYLDFHDFQTTTFKLFYSVNLKFLLAITFSFGTIREFIENAMGLDILVLACFVFLIIAEWQTGIKADMIRRKNKFSSRKAGRMILKIGVYIGILFVLYTFSSRTKKIEFVGFDINPLAWLYYVVFVAIIFQLAISYLENLGVLGYSEAKGIAGIVLRKYNKWFEFDGTKDGDNFNKE